MAKLLPIANCQATEHSGVNTTRWCPPFSAGDVAFLFICFPGLSLVVSALFRWRCSISVHFFICFPGLSLVVSTLFRWPCSTSIHGLSLLVSFLFRWPCSTPMHGLSLLVSALFRWPCGVSSIQLSTRSVAAGLRPFLLAM